VLIVEADARVRQALADLVGSTDGFAVLAACESADEAENTCRVSHADAALVSLRASPTDANIAVITRLAAQVPVLAVAPFGSLAGRAIAAGAAAFYDQDGDADALVALLHEVIDGAGVG